MRRQLTPFLPRLLRPGHVAAALMLCLSLAPWGPGRAGELPDPVQVCYENWTPYYFTGPDGRPMGPVVELIREIAAQQGLALRFQERPFKRCEAEAREGYQHIVLLSDQQSNAMLIGETPLAFWSIGAIVRRDSPHETFPGFAAFRDQRALLMGDYEYPPDITAQAENWQTITINFTTPDEGEVDIRPFRMLETGRVDVFWEDLAWSARAIRKYGLPLKVLWPPAVIEPSYLGYAPNQRALREMMEAAIGERREDGRLDQLYRQLTGAPWNPAHMTAETN